MPAIDRHVEPHLEPHRHFDRGLLQFAAEQRAHALRDEAFDAVWLGLRRVVKRVAFALLQGTPGVRRSSRT